MKIIKSASLEKLKNTVFKILKDNETPKIYLDSDIDEFFNGENWSTEVAKELIDIPSQLSLELGDSESDFKNVKIFHTALKDVTPRILTDERIWVYLTHKTFKEYMSVRWDPKKRTDIGARYFLKGSGTRSLLRNGIARLWFIGHVTYDENLENPYEYTELILSQQRIMADFLERPSISMNPIFLKQSIQFIFDNNLNNEIGFRSFLKKYVQASGISRLDSMNENEMNNFLNSNFGQT